MIYLMLLILNTNDILPSETLCRAPEAASRKHQATSRKRQAASDKRQAAEPEPGSGSKAASIKHQATREKILKLQATSNKRLDF